MDFFMNIHIFFLNQGLGESQLGHPPKRLRFKPLRLDGDDLAAGEDQLLRTTRGGISEGGCHGHHGRPHHGDGDGEEKPRLVLLGYDCL